MGRAGKKAKKEKKLIITFDEEARRNYLTGFSKRKKLRRKQAKADKLKKELVKKKEKRAKKKSVLKQTMMRYNLLDTDLPTHDDKGLSSNVTTQQYSGGTTVTISDIPALEARTINSASSCPEGSQIVSHKSKSTSKSPQLRKKSEKKLKKLNKWNYI